MNIKVNGKKIGFSEVALEDVVLDRNVMLKFIYYLHNSYAVENIQFWLETQIFKYMDEEDIIQEVERIFEKYFEDCQLNLDEPILVDRLKERMKLPDRTVFLQTQNAIWALLKMECFPKFKLELGKSMTIKISRNSKLCKTITRAEPFTVELYDKFVELTIFHIPNLEDFRPTTLPNDEYNEHERQNLPTIDEVWLDRDLMLAFREYLYQQLASDNLSFYLKIVNFELLIPEEDLQQEAEEIYEQYISSDAQNNVNLDYTLVSKIEKSIKKKHVNRKIFESAQESVYQTLEVQWFPQFLSSPLYKACNEETIEFKASDGGKERSDTLIYYDSLVAMKK